jgi:hypothetical protein
MLEHFVFHNSKSQLAALGHLIITFRIASFSPVHIKMDTIPAVRRTDMFQYSSILSCFNMN